MKQSRNWKGKGVGGPRPACLPCPPANPRPGPGWLSGAGAWPPRLLVGGEQAHSVCVKGAEACSARRPAALLFHWLEAHT